MKAVNSIGKRLIALLLTLIMVLGMLPTGMATSGSATGYATVESLTEGMTITADGATTTAEYSGTLSWATADASVGRTEAGWSVGIKVTAPTGYNEEDAKFKLNNDAPSSFKDKKNGDAITLWVPVDAEKLRMANLENGGSYCNTYSFDWNGDGEYEQTVVQKYDAANTVLEDETNVRVYPARVSYGTVVSLSGVATITGGPNSKVCFDQGLAVEWVKEEKDINRYQDGWWAGVRITAPAGTETANAQFKMNDELHKYGECMDSDAGDMGIWVPLNELIDNGTMADRVLEFDWNNDGLFEQKLTISVDKDKTVLTKEGVQNYPKLGSVSCYHTNSTIEGNKTGETSVMVNSVTLDWVDANPAIGRNEKSWWVGIRVDAPEQMSAEALKNAKYQSDSVGDWDKVTLVKSFWSNKDSAEEDTKHNIQLWFSVTPQQITDAKNAEKNISMFYRFDWNNDGKYEQQITFRVDPKGVTLNKKEQTEFGFETTNPDDILITKGEYTNLASGGQSSGTVTYEVTAGNDYATIDENTGKLTFTEAGRITVKATKPEDDYYLSAEATYTITVKKDTDEPSFKKSNPEITYGENNNTYKNTLENVQEAENATITYNITAGYDRADINKGTGELTIKKAGEITVTATITGRKKYEKATVQYTLNVKKADRKSFAFTDGDSKTVKWSADKLKLEVTGDIGTGEISWYITECDCATIDSKTGEITLSKEGTFTVKAVKAEDDCYNEASAEITITVNKAEQEGFGFSIAEDTITYNDSDKNAKSAEKNKYTLITGGGPDDMQLKEITYTVEDYTEGETVVGASSGEAAATVENGVLTIRKAGKIKVTATREGDDRYNDATAEFILTINKDNQDFSFENGDSANLRYGTTSYTNAVNFTDDYSAGSTLTYSISDNEIGATIDADTGEITFADSEEKVGTITVTAKKAGDDCYNECVKSYTLTVAYLTVPENVKPTVTGTKLNADSEWYTGDVKIHAPDGYTISTSNALSGNTWQSELAYSQSGGKLIAEVYLKNEDGHITDKVCTKPFKAELEDPKLTVSFKAPLWNVILENITYGIFQSESVRVEIDASAVSGIATLEYRTNNESEMTKIVGGTEVEFNISAEYRDELYVKVVSNAGRTATNSKHLVLDMVTPQIEAAYRFDAEKKESDNIIYTQGNATITFSIDEANFDLRGLDKLDQDGNALNEKTAIPIISVNEVVQEGISWRKNETTGKWDAELALKDEGDYVITVKYTDPAGNEGLYEKSIHIDLTDPTIDVTYDNNDAKNGNCYKPDRTATVKITERNFSAEDVVLIVTAKDIQDNDVAIPNYKAYAKNPENWTAEGNVRTLNPDGMKFEAEAIYTVTINYTDLSGRAAEQNAAVFVIDRTAPTVTKIEYKETVGEKLLDSLTFGLYHFFKDNVTVTLTAEDITSGVDTIDWSYTKQNGSSSVNAESTEGTFTADQITFSNKGKTATASFTIDASARGYISATATDRAGNSSGTKDDTKILVVDNIAPERTVTYTPYKVLDAETMLDVEGNQYTEGDNSILYYKDDATVTFKITEANFDLSLNKGEAPAITVNDEAKAVTWEKGENDVWTATYTISGNGDYVVKMTYTDLSTNEMVEYESCKIAIDGKEPKVEVKYNDGKPTQTIGNTAYYKNTQTVEVKITEHNFRADDVALTVTAKDIQGNDVVIPDYADYAKNRENWTSNGDVRTLKTDGMVFATDAVYTFDIVYDDICDNYAKDYAEDHFVVDHAAPTDLKISYSKPVLEELIEKLTYGFYQAKVTVTLTAEDITSGVDTFHWSYTKQNGSSSVNAESTEGTFTADQITFSNKGKTATASFTIDASARGCISVTATDRAGNSSGTKDDTRILVVDNIAPKISVTYTPNEEKTSVQFVNEGMATVNSFEDAVNAFYNGDVTAKIVIDEANFFEGKTKENGEVIHEVGIKLTRTDDNGVETVTEYLPEGAAQKYEAATAQTFTWTHDGDKHTLQIPYNAEGDYVLELEYTDFSTNAANITATDSSSKTTYSSKIVTVDKTAPKLKVEYEDGNNAVHNIGGRNYFNAVRKATITVTEHNFRASDVVADVKATNFKNDSVDIEKFAETLADADCWTSNGNVHTITLKYSVEANYDFKISVTDLAENNPAEFVDYFAVDVTPPSEPVVTYSTNVFQEILQAVTFGYYNAKVTVTVTAEDTIAGVYRFEYSYKNNEGVSRVNAELLNQKIEEADIKHNGITATASFEIPKEALGSENQFNGTVEVTAYDRCENSSNRKETKQIIVDNISPTATVTYNDPVKTVNDVSYYDGAINGTFLIEEANFDASDVIVSVTKDGESYPMNVAWQNNTVDIHTGTFALTEDGDYIISVQYRDKSGNQMNTYTSNRMTLDMQAPVIRVSDIRADSANKDETYGFTLTVSDTNLDGATVKPVLKAVRQESDGVYGITQIDLGEAKVEENGSIYSYTVENLPDDGLYTLVCEAKDMSGNTTTEILLEDGNPYAQVQFSINRKGSVFAYGNEFTEKLVEQYYVYQVDEDVVIVEVNVDPIEKFTLSLNGTELVEGTDFTTEQTSEEGRWSKRSYTIRKELFEDEGEYSVIVSSTDKADTTAFSDVRNLTLAFVVDRTKPVLTISGLVSGGRYQTNEQLVTLIPTDEGGRLSRLYVEVLNSSGEALRDENGNDISVRFEMSGEELLAYLAENDGKITFTVPAGLNNQVRIICNDCAVNAENQTNEYNELFDRVTVSQNRFIIFYANTPAFIATIAGVLAVTALVVVLLKRKSAKKAKAKA